MAESKGFGAYCRAAWRILKGILSTVALIAGVVSFFTGRTASQLLIGAYKHLLSGGSELVRSPADSSGSELVHSLADFPLFLLFNVIPTCLFFIIAILISQTPMKQYRTKYKAALAEDVASCEHATIETGKDLLLGCVEFDDHGWFWDTNQMNAVLERVRQEDSDNGLLIVVFAHGWNQNASYNDDGVATFRGVLQQMQEIENKQSHTNKLPVRKVVGIYLGWRGLSFKFAPFKELSFWGRTRTAHIIGRGGVRELLLKLDDLSRVSRVRHLEETKRNRRQSSRLFIIGHSCGGALLYSALGPLLEERLIGTTNRTAQGSPSRGFGDLVVLINPVFAAAQLEMLQRTAMERTFLNNQPFNLAIFSSKADWANRFAFPVGQFVLTILEQYRDREQRRANITAVGHYGPYITHDLQALHHAKGMRPSENHGFRTTAQSAQKIQELREQIKTNRAKSKKEFDEEDNYHFSHANMVPRATWGRFSPVCIISVDSKIIPDHSCLNTEAFLTFLREFILAFGEHSADS